MDCVDALFRNFLYFIYIKARILSFRETVLPMNPPLQFFISNGELILAIPQLATSLEQLDYPQYCEYPYCGFTASTRTVPVGRVLLLYLYCKYSC